MCFLERSVCSVVLLGSFKPDSEVPLNQTQKLHSKTHATVLPISITNNLSAPSLPRCSINWGKICSLGNKRKYPDPQEPTVLVFNCNKLHWPSSLILLTLCSLDCPEVCDFADSFNCSSNFWISCWKSSRSCSLSMACSCKPRQRESEHFWRLHYNLEYKNTWVLFFVVKKLVI